MHEMPQTSISFQGDLNMLRQLIIDTETTGLEPGEGHRIIEFAALEMINRQLTGNTLHLYFNPQRDIPPEATSIHGITWEQVKDQPTFDEDVDKIISFIEGAELIIHNAKFDLKFLDHHFAQLQKQVTLNYTKSVIDTLILARKKFPGAKNSLDALCDRFKVDRTNRIYHGALIDCELLAYVYLELTREQISLLGEEETTRNQKKEFKRLELANPGLAVSVSPQENQAHLDYLQQLDSLTNGNCLWYNQSQKN